MNYGELPKRMQKQQKQQTPKNKSTQTRLTSKVFQEVEEFRVESWTDRDVKELAQDMGWSFQMKGNQYE